MPRKLIWLTTNLEPYLILNNQLNTENKQEIKALESFKTAYEFLLKKEKALISQQLEPLEALPIQVYSMLEPLPQ